jgi:hypothetical protein
MQHGLERALAGALPTERQGAGSGKVPNEPKEAAANATAKNETPKLGLGICHPSPRPMEVVKDGKGEWWLCDKGVHLLQAEVGQVIEPAREEKGTLRASEDP